MRRVTIIGGGITGLATAYFLEQQDPSVACTLLEASPHLGGKLITEECDGFRIEGGPDSFITTKPAALDLCKELGLADQLIASNEKNNSVFVCRDSKLIPLPHGFRLAVPTEIGPMLRTPLLSLAGKLRMGMEYFIPPQPAEHDESVGSFLRRRIGREATERMAGPLMAGIYMADVDRLSMHSTFPMFAAMERKHGSMMKAMWKSSKAPRTSHPTAMFNSIQGGMGTLATRLTGQLRGEHHKNCSVRSIQAAHDSWQLSTEGDGPETLLCDDVVFAVPSHVAADLLQPVHPAASEPLRAIRYASSAVVVLGYEHHEPPMEGFGFIVPPDEPSPLQACTWLSNKFEYRAPKGGLLVRAFLRDDDPSKTDDALITTVRDELARLVAVRGEPTVARVFRWHRANPQYDVGHATRVRDIEDVLKKRSGLHVAGSPYHGIGIPDCIASAKRCAEAILDS